jgi:hypothetical protein
LIIGSSTWQSKIFAAFAAIRFRNIALSPIFSLFEPERRFLTDLT